MVDLFRNCRQGALPDYDIICTFDYFRTLTKSGKYRSSFLSSNHVVMKPKDPNQSKIIDVDLALEGNSSYDILTYWDTCSQSDSDYAQILATIKLSHRFKDSPSFEKTYTDLMYFVGGHPSINSYIKQLPQELQEILVKREKETYVNQQKISLMKTKDEFFANDGVEYIHDHDMLHELVAILSVPAYKSFLKDGHDVYCDHKKFLALPISRKLHSVMEESAVIALERGVFPFNKQATIQSEEMKKLLKFALRKVCTSLTSGWFRAFAYEHYTSISLAMEDDLYVKNLLAKIRNM